MVHQHVAGPQHCEQVGGALPVQARLRHGGERVVLELGPIQRVQRPQGAEIQESPNLVHVLIIELQLAGQETPHLVGDRSVELQAHRAGGAAAANEHRLDGGEEILRLVLLHVHIGVAGDPEDVVREDLHPGEQRVEVRGQHLLDGYEPFAVGQGHEPVEQRRHLHPGEAPLPGHGVADDRRQVQRQARDVREGVGRVHRERREHREDPLLEQPVELGPIVPVQLGPGHDPDPRLVERGQNLLRQQVPGAIDELGHALADSRELLARGHPLGGGDEDPRRGLLLQPGHPDLEELVEVLAEDRQELRPLQQGRGGVLRQGQHARVEVEPGQLAVEVAGVRRREKRGWGGDVHLVRAAPPWPARTPIDGSRLQHTSARRGKSERRVNGR